MLRAARRRPEERSSALHAALRRHDRRRPRRPEGRRRVRAARSELPARSPRFMLATRARRRRRSDDAARSRTTRSRRSSRTDAARRDSARRRVARRRRDASPTSSTPPAPPGGPRARGRAPRPREPRRVACAQRLDLDADDVVLSAHDALASTSPSPRSASSLGAGAAIVVASRRAARPGAVLAALLERPAPTSHAPRPSPGACSRATGLERPAADVAIHRAGEALPRDLADAPARARQPRS